MTELAVIVLRLAQFTAAAILLGSSLFFIYGLPPVRLPPTQLSGARRLVYVGALVLALTAAAGLLAQTAVMAGSFHEALKPDSLAAVLGVNLGKAAIVRVTCGVIVAALLLAIRSPGTLTWSALALLGAIATASFAWSGHGATSDGADYWVHLAADIPHAWAASGWIGALFVFGLLLRDRGQSRELLAATHVALGRFATAGTIFVVTLLVTGLVNSWYLVGPQNVSALVSTRYGVLLLLKVAAFAGMLALAAANRFQLTPRLGDHLGSSAPHPPSLRELRRSLAVEIALGLTALALVSWFGTLEPPAAM